MSESIYEYLRGQYPANTTRERLEQLYQMWVSLVEQEKIEKLENNITN
jgi:hypothetical protein